jgi:small subunit ribosomal protein S5
MEAVGITDVLSKTFGSTNTINIVKATIKGLETLRDPRAELARRRGVAPAQQAAPVAAASEG